jgi:RNA polymerase sigma-70 factor, ECF subfamily
MLPTMPHPLEPDTELMLRVKRGDMAAFEALVDKYKQPVANLLSRTLGDPMEAEDLAQNVFIQVFRAAARYEPSAKFSTWLFTIARNLCWNELRRRSRHPAVSLEQQPEDHEELGEKQYEDQRVTLPPDMLLRQELENNVRQALAELPENQRMAILLFQEEELAYEDIAKILGCSLSATKSMIHRGRETLKQKLKPYLRSGEWHEPSR